MKLQIASHLAIYALLEVAGNPDRPLSVVEIADKYGVSTHHLAKVMHALGRANLVRSIRGVGGGYQFCGNARRITLLDVVQLFEDIAEPHGRLGEATEEGRALRQVLAEIDDIAHATLGSITIATMLNLVDRCRTDKPVAPRPSTAASA